VVGAGDHPAGLKEKNGRNSLPKKRIRGGSRGGVLSRNGKLTLSQRVRIRIEKKETLKKLSRPYRPRGKSRRVVGTGIGRGGDFAQGF